MAIIKGVARKEESDPQHSDGENPKLACIKYIFGLRLVNLHWAQKTWTQPKLSLCRPVIEHVIIKDAISMTLCSSKESLHVQLTNEPSKQLILLIFDVGMSVGEDSLWLWGAKQPRRFFWLLHFPKKLAVQTVTIYRLVKTASGRFRK